MKKCSKCLTKKDTTEFYFRVGQKFNDGLSYQCKECIRDEERDRYNIKHSSSKRLQNKLLNKTLESSNLRSCTKCKEHKSIDEFKTKCSRKKNLFSWCIHCRSKHSTNWAQTTPHRKKYSREWKYKNRYGIDIPTFEKMKDEQNSQCQICGKLDKDCKRNELVIDHDHSNGMIRGLLCNWCNSALGLIFDSPDIAIKLYEYLIKYNKIALEKGMVSKDD